MANNADAGPTAPRYELITHDPLEEGGISG